MQTQQDDLYTVHGIDMNSRVQAARPSADEEPELLGNRIDAEARRLLTAAGKVDPSYEDYVAAAEQASRSLAEDEQPNEEPEDLDARLSRANAIAAKADELIEAGKFENDQSGYLLALEEAARELDTTY